MGCSCLQRDDLSLRRVDGFTLVELLVATVVFLLILGMVFSITNQTQKIWKGTTAKIEAFQNARAAYDTLTLRLRQATLNTYLDYYDAANNLRPPASDPNAATWTPATYARNSDLHFVVDQAANIVPSVAGGANIHPTQAVFYQAPLSFTLNGASYGKLTNIMNACGYFLEFNTDKPYLPAFLSTSSGVQERYRYRLMEFLQPTESLAIYNTASTGIASDYDKWFTNFLPPNVTQASAPLSVLAENIVALVILPELSPYDAAAVNPIAPNYTYDSRAGNITNLAHHQLPPLLRVVMVAIDETSAQRLNPTGSSAPPSLIANLGTLFQNASNLDKDLTTLTDALAASAVNYRVFDTEIALRGAKWSTK